MNIRTKLILSVGILAGMIILLVALSVVNLQILTATEPDSPVDFRYRCYLHSCQYRVAGLASPFHQQAYSGIDAWYP